MNKQVVIFLSGHGWSQARIGRTFGVHRSLICRIVNQFKRLGSEGESLCEVCTNPVLKEQYIKLEGMKKLLVCSECKEQLSTMLTSSS